MDNNFNVGRTQAETRDGVKRFKIKVKYEV